MTMQRVYLDQMHWIAIAKALQGHRKDAPEVLTMIGAAVDYGYASFPLSGAHVFETWKTASAKRRHDLAPAMATISKNHSIASPTILLPAELDRAFQTRFGRPEFPLQLRPFSRGLTHSLGQPISEMTATARAMVQKINPDMSNEEVADYVEMVLLAGPPENLPVADIAQPPLEFAEAFAEGETQQARLFSEHGADKQLRRRGVTVRALIDIKAPIEEAQARANVSTAEMFSLGPDGLTDLLLDLPSRAAGLELMWWQHDNPQTKWEPNDMNDIGYLSTAVAYCDVVVTERRWTHMLNQSGAAKRCGTTVISKLDDLTELLVTASTAT